MDWSQYPPSARLLVLFDQHCGLCRATVQWMSARDRRQRLVLLPLQTPMLLTDLGIAKSDALREIQVVARDGRRWHGADGVLEAVTALPGYGWLRGLWYVPGARPVGRWVYRQVARRRKRDVCDGDHCSLL